MEMTEEEYEVVKRVALDTAPRRRITIIAYLLDGAWRRTKEIANALNLPQTTATYELEDLMMVEVLSREADVGEGEELRQHTPYRWQLGDDISRLIESSGLELVVKH
jgi:predicted ArsR family transcriptional regulator